jgi:dimethylargininase
VTVWHALTREISPAIDRCELTHLARAAIDLAIARGQHAAYEAALTTLGCHVTRLASGPEMPDAVFIEDTAVVVDEMAIVTRPGAESRRGEIEAVALALAPFRPVVRLNAPSTLDGGDVLVVGRRVFIGATTRTNAVAMAEIQRFLQPHGYRVAPVPVQGCLHLKSAATALDDHTILLNPRWADRRLFSGVDAVEIDAEEPFAANVARVGAALLAAEECPRTVSRLRERGYAVTTVANSELAKAEGAITCGSLLFPAAGM